MNDEFIAIRKQTRTDNAAFAALSITKKQQQIKTTAQEKSKRSSKLLQLGLAQLQPATSSSRRAAPDDGYFSRLGYVGAYIVNPKQRDQAEKAKEILADDYFILPNVVLSLPPTVKTAIRSSRKNGQHDWPDASGVAAAHRDGIKGQGVRVLVLDTGCDADHIEFGHCSRINFRYIDPRGPRQKRDVRGFDPQGHGTHVCGVISGRTTGVSPDVELYVAAVIESETLTTSLERILVGLDWLLFEVIRKDQRPAILNMSLGFRPADVNNAIGATDLTTALRLSLRTLVADFNVLAVVASGNDGKGHLRIPGYFPEVVSVGAVNFQNRRAPFTSQGEIELDRRKFKVPHLYGYGVDVYSALERNEDNRCLYAMKSGTSMAAAYVTGIAALYAQAEELSGQALRERLLETANRGIVRFARRQK